MNTRKQTSFVTSRLGGLSVSTKIGVGFAIVLVLHLSVVALGHYGVKKAERDRRAQSELLDQVQVFYEIERRVGELQRNVLLFASTGYEGPGLRVARLQRQLRERLDKAAAIHSDATDKDAGELDAMRQSLDAQESIFQAVVADRARRRTLVEEDFESHGERFDSAIKSLKLAEAPQLQRLYAAQAAFNAARLKALQFVNNPASELVTAVKARLADARDNLHQLAPRAAPNDESLTVAIAATDDFADAFIQMVQATRGYLHLVNVVLAGESVEFLRLAEEARQNCLQSADRLTSDMRRDSQRFEAINTAFSVLTILLGIVAAWLIGRAVAPPLNAITTTFDALARGESCDRIPGVGRRDELGKLAHAAEVFRAKAAETERLLADVTRMKDMERQLAQAQKLESMGQLAAGVAHEINTPMQSVASNVDFLSVAVDDILAVIETVNAALAVDHDAPGGLKQAIQSATGEERFLRAVENVSPAIADTTSAANRVVDIVRAMKTMSHPGNAEFVSTDINQVVRDAATISSNRWKNVASLDFEFDDALPHPLAQGAALSQVLLNLFVNAADAIVERHGDDQPSGSIVARTYSDADSVYIEVEDNGVGVPDDRRERVFEMFYTTKDVGKGTGQGLAFCYDVVVRQHQGEISIASEQEDGTRFVVRIPITPQDDDGLEATFEESLVSG